MWISFCTVLAMANSTKVTPKKPRELQARFGLMQLVAQGTDVGNGHRTHAANESNGDTAQESVVQAFWPRLELLALPNQKRSVADGAHRGGGRPVVDKGHFSKDRAAFQHGHLDVIAGIGCQGGGAHQRKRGDLRQIIGLGALEHFYRARPHREERFRLLAFAQDHVASWDRAQLDQFGQRPTVQVRQITGKFEVPQKAD